MRADPSALHRFGSAPTTDADAWAGRTRRLALTIVCAGAVAGCSSRDARGPPPGGDVHTYDVDSLGVPRFVDTNYIDLGGLTRISLFRSSEGHDYSDNFEHCRSMKHYFEYPTSSTLIYAPVSGEVTNVFDEWAGTQIQIRSDVQPAFTFIVFHVTLTSPLSIGSRVTEGAVLGRHVGTQTFSDIAVGVNTPGGWRLVSYFDTLTASAFAPFQARGIASPASVIITREQRDAAPLTCSGETFTNAGSDPYPRDVAF